MRADNLSGQPRTDSPDFRTDNTPPLGGVRPASGPEELEVIWSQSLFKAGLVPSLSSFPVEHGPTPTEPERVAYWDALQPVAPPFSAKICEVSADGSVGLSPQTQLYPPTVSR